MFQRRAFTTAKRLIRDFKPKYGPFVNGQLIVDRNEDPNDTYKLRTPHSRQFLCEIENASPELTNEAIEIAHKEYLKGTWSRADVRHRAKVLNTIAQYIREEFDLLLFYEVSQTGRPVKEMKAQVIYCRLCSLF